jgi:hypothetical protein
MVKRAEDIPLIVDPEICVPGLIANPHLFDPHLTGSDLLFKSVTRPICKDWICFYRDNRISPR